MQPCFNLTDSITVPVHIIYTENQRILQDNYVL